jgi:hypothetical protein
VWEEALRVLKDEDVCTLNEQAITAEEAATGEQLDNLVHALGTPAGIMVAEGLAAGEGSHMLSWIGYTVGATMDEDNPKLHEGICILILFPCMTPMGYYQHYVWSGAEHMQGRIVLRKRFVCCMRKCGAQSRMGVPQRVNGIYWQAWSC